MRVSCPRKRETLMERIQRQNKLCSLDQKVNVRRAIEVQEFAEDQRSTFKEDQFQQSEDLSSIMSFKDPNFLALVSLQTLEKPWEVSEVPEFHSPILSETNHYYHNPSLEGINEAISSQELTLNPLENANAKKRKCRSKNLAITSMTKEKRKRRRTKPTKNIEEMENQRLTHITVERNRRRQMSIHLNSLRSLIPSNYIQRGDQASIVGGAIDFVKILEQHLQSLEAQKMISANKDNTLSDISSNKLCATNEEQTNELRVDATMTENHVNLKIQCPKKQGQLLKSIIMLEKLRFTVLHLNITSPSNVSVSYSFNLKMEDDCDLGSVGEIKTAIRKIFE